MILRTPAPLKLRYRCGLPQFQFLFSVALDNLQEELERGFKWDIIGLSETKLKGNYSENLKNGHLLYSSGVPVTASRKHGTGFIVHKALRDNIIELKGISERL